jgi:hypothetical protein
MRRWIASILGLAVLAAEPVFACRFHSAAVLEDVQYADLVLVGRIRSYHIVRDEALRERMLAAPDLLPNLRSLYEDPRHLLMTDYARVEIDVEEELLGNAPRPLIITWYGFGSGDRERLGAGPFLIALRRPSSPMPPLRGPSARFFPNAEPDLYTILEAPCSGAFVFEDGGEDANIVRRLAEMRDRSD